MRGWGTPSRDPPPINRLFSPGKLSNPSDVVRFCSAVAILASFHLIFVVMLYRATARNWIDSPAAIVLTVAHVSLGSIVSVWLARVLPRVLAAPTQTRWLSLMTTSFVFAVATSAWLGHAAFGMIPTKILFGLDFSFVGLFLTIPCSIYFWQLGKTFSW